MDEDVCFLCVGWEGVQCRNRVVCLCRNLCHNLTPPAPPSHVSTTLQGQHRFYPEWPWLPCPIPDQLRWLAKTVMLVHHPIPEASMPYIAVILWTSPSCPIEHSDIAVIIQATCQVSAVDLVSRPLDSLRIKRAVPPHVPSTYSSWVPTWTSLIPVSQAVVYAPARDSRPSHQVSPESFIH